MVSYHGRKLQLKQQNRYAPARSLVTVCEWTDGRIRICYREQEMEWEEVFVPQVKATTCPTSSMIPVNMVSQVLRAVRKSHRRG